MAVAKQEFGVHRGSCAVTQGKIAGQRQVAHRCLFQHFAVDNPTLWGLNIACFLRSAKEIWQPHFDFGFIVCRPVTHLREATWRALRLGDFVTVPSKGSQPLPHIDPLFVRACPTEPIDCAPACTSSAWLLHVWNQLSQKRKHAPPC